MVDRFNLQLNSASSGDTIEVGSGTYVECLDPNGKNIDIVGTGTVLINGSNCTGATIALNGTETVNVSNVQLKNTNGLVLSVGSTATANVDGVSVSGSGYFEPVSIVIGWRDLCRRDGAD